MATLNLHAHKLQHAARWAAKSCIHDLAEATSQQNRSNAEQPKNHRGAQFGCHAFGQNQFSKFKCFLP